MTKVNLSPREVAGAILAEKKQGRVLPTNVRTLLQGEPVELEYFDSERDIDGRFELCLGRPSIFVNLRGRTEDYPRARFTLAHELGHYFLHRRLLREGRVFRDDRINLDQDAVLDQCEREANDFAIEILLPAGCVERRLDQVATIDIDFINRLREDAHASFQATAIRVARRTHDSICVLLVSSQGVVDWAVASDSWRHSKLPAGMLVGRPIPSGSIGARKQDDYKEERVPLKAWTANQSWRSLDLYESAIRTPFGRLVLLGAGDEDDHDDHGEQQDDE
jgi:hypothetical protein